MVKRMLTILFFAFFIACSKEEPIIMKKEMKTTDEHQPALIEEEKEDEVDALIEFTFPEEQVIINLKNIPILNEYLQATRSEEHTSELQSRGHLVCRLLLEKKKPT